MWRNQNKHGRRDQPARSIRDRGSGLHWFARGKSTGEQLAPRRARVRRARRAGLEVLPVDQLSYVEVAGEQVAVSYLNHYVCNHAVIVPVAGTELDAPALAAIGAGFPHHEVVPVPGAVWKELQAFAADAGARPAH